MLDTILGASLAIKRIQSGAANIVRAAGISANLATGLGVATGVLSGVAFGGGSRSWGIAMLALSAAFDAIDGTIARESGAPTPFGGVIDLCSDRVVEAAVIIGIVWQRPELYL